MSSINSITSKVINELQIPKTSFAKISNIGDQLRELEQDTFEKMSENATFSKATFEKAKDIVMETITGAKPKESLVYIMDDKIIHHELGDMSSVKITDTMKELLNNPKNRIAVVHSHPGNFGASTMPVSYQDFASINSYEAARSIYAINKQGEYSLLEKVGKQRPSALKVLNYEVKNYNETNSQELYEKMLYSKFDEIKSLLPENPTEEDLYLAFRLLAEKDPQFASKLSYVEMQEALAQHNFWLKYASELGMKYDTNYSCFK